MQPRIMYIENKADGSARIGLVTFSKTGKSLYYRGQVFRSLKGRGFKANYYDVASREEYWISGPKKDGNDRLYGGMLGVEIDEDIRSQYVEFIRGARAGS